MNAPHGILVLNALADCPHCRGSAEVKEPHGEVLDCDCVFNRKFSIREELLIESGRYWINPAPEYLLRMNLKDEGGES